MTAPTTTALARIAEVTGYSRVQVELVKDTIAKGASDDELMLFLSIAQRSGLDPFSKQIYLIERRANVDGQWRTSRQPQTAIDGLRLIADRTGNYTPGRAPTFTYDDNGQLETATAYVKKWAKGDWHEAAATAHYREYVQTAGKGDDRRPTQMWADKPHIMLAKCAEALALRRAFPAETSGLYTSDEIREDTPAITVVNATPRTALPPAPSVSAATGEVIEASAVVVRDLTEVKALVVSIRQAGGDVPAMTPRQMRELPEAEFAKYVAGMRSYLAELEAEEDEAVVAMEAPLTPTAQAA